METALEIQRAEVAADIAALVAAHPGNQYFLDALEHVAGGRDLLYLLARYIHFNSIFSCGVATLAGRIGVRQDLFRDPNEPSGSLFGDRSAEVGSQIFFAAIDEFGDHTLARRGTHRSLAQATLRGAVQFFAMDEKEMRGPSLINDATRETMAQVEYGYGMTGDLDERRLLYGIGFHIASETLADEEFCILDAALRRRFPELVGWLEDTQIGINGFQLPGYHWIRIHTTVEAEHSNAAFNAAELALKYYAGAHTSEGLKSWILDGFRGFSDAQTCFMSGLLQPARG